MKTSNETMWTGLAQVWRWKRRSVQSLFLAATTIVVVVVVMSVAERFFGS